MKETGHRQPMRAAPTIPHTADTSDQHLPDIRSCSVREAWFAVWAMLAICLPGALLLFVVLPDRAFISASPCAFNQSATEALKPNPSYRLVPGLCLSSQSSKESDGTTSRFDWASLSKVTNRP